jgi:dynein intermediate chain 1
MNLNFAKLGNHFFPSVGSKEPSSSTRSSSSSSSIMLQSSKSVPPSKQNKSRRLVDTVKSPDDSDLKPRREADTSESNPQKQSEQNPVPQKKKKKPKDTEYQSSVQVQEPARRVIKPENQLELTKDELEEKITRILTGDDPNKPKNVCKFSFKDRCFKPDPPGQGDNMAIHFSLEGSSMHVDSDECKKYVERVGKPREQEEPDKVTTDGQTTATTSSGLPTISITTSVDHAKNQFNFSERASQTFNYPLKSSGVNTEPPPMTQYQDGVSQWRIYDSYKSEFIVSQHIDKQEGSARISFEDKFASICVAKKDSDDSNADTIHSKSMEHSLKTMERLVNQNAEDEIFHDFKYFEDKADEFRNGEGTLLPLWRFSANRANRKQVTSLCWNPLYNDMFAVGYGSYDFMRQGTGMLCCFSLKNTSHPEYVINTESGVMCLDFHPRHPSLLAVGYYDGMVSAYDISNGTKQPIYSSSLQSGKHSDPVWQVHWHDNGCLSKELNFYSISTDGKVANWAMTKNHIKMEPIMQLKLINHPTTKEDSDEPALTGLAGGCCFDFNKKLDDLFLVGTEEGSIHECSKAYRGQYIKTYDGHHMRVHRVRWNPFHQDIFISCSEDWTVKIWDHKSSKCLLHFDLGNAVGDVCWSPFSSTVFAAVTTDGKVHVFDLSQNKREPFCAQKVVKRARLTNASFNVKDFILIVGDDRGGVHSLKLSPNLRKLGVSDEEKKEGEEEKKVDGDTLQHGKMMKLLASLGGDKNR